MRFVLGLILSLVFAAPLAAQPIVIHEHTQKTVYNDPSEWPFLSAQTHWTPGNDLTFDPSLWVTGLPPTFWPDQNIRMSHTHVECWAPVYGETTLAPFTLPCQLQLVHVQGHIEALHAQLGTSIEWQMPDGTWRAQTSMYRGGFPFPVVGDPMGIRVFPFRVTLDPRMRDVTVPSNVRNVPDHGMWHGYISAETVFFDGARAETALWIPFYSVIDTSQAVPYWAVDYWFGTRGSLNGHGMADATFGTSISQFVNAKLPILAPISTPVVINAGGSAYGVTANFPMGTTRVIADIDLHHGIAGRTLMSLQGQGAAGGPVTLDPATLGPGAHRVAMTWEQTSDGGVGLPTGREFSTLFVFTVTVGDGSPQPPVDVCNDGIDNNGNGQIDEGCAPTVPVETWAPVAGVFEKSSTTGAVRLVIGGVVIATWP